VICIGYPYDDRYSIVRDITASGLKVGSGIGLLWEHYNQIYNRAKIGFTKSVMGDIPQRIFENMAQGCAVLTDEPIDLFKLGFVEGRDYIAYDSPEAAVIKAHSLIANDRWREIAASGKERVRPHSWDTRAQTLLRTMKLC
jgi:spore maturation protein CgeB